MNIKYNFDEIIDRRRSGSYKWDSEHGRDLIPLWVADMDFRAAPCITDALRRRVDHGVFGYTHVGAGYYRALRQWFAGRHGWDIRPSQVIYTPGVVPALSAIIKAFTSAGDGVIVMTPVYNCFFSSIRNNGCRVVESPLIQEALDDRYFTYKIDFDSLEALCADSANRMLLLCNPHNPAGRAWTREELQRVADICRRHHVKVVSDEIHCELVFNHAEYVPYGTVDPRAVVCVSPSKAFNTAGLQIANIVAPVRKEREAIDRAVNINEVCDVNPFGPVALEAAYSDKGAEWLSQLLDYLYANYEVVSQAVAMQLPKCRVALLEATYLVWIDVSALGVPVDELCRRMKDETGVWVNPGTMYGAEGFIRVNIASPRALLSLAMVRMVEFLQKF